MGRILSPHHGFQFTLCQPSSGGSTCHLSLPWCPFPVLLSYHHAVVPTASPASLFPVVATSYLPVLTHYSPASAVPVAEGSILRQHPMSQTTGEGDIKAFIQRPEFTNSFLPGVFCSGQLAAKPSFAPSGPTVFMMSSCRCPEWPPPVSVAAPHLDGRAWHFLGSVRVALGLLHSGLGCPSFPLPNCPTRGSTVGAG